MNQRRAANGLPFTELYLGLHIGAVFYGNIGSKDRLDFTVVGPAVNDVSPIAAMCRSVDQPLLVSLAFAAALGEARSRLASVGRYALRGVGAPAGLIHAGMSPERELRQLEIVGKREREAGSSSVRSSRRMTASTASRGKLL